MINTELRNLVTFMDEVTMKKPQLPLLLPNSDFVFPTLTSELDDLLTQYNQSKKLLLPELRNHGESLAIFSDYGGEHQSGRFYTYTFFVTTHGVLFCLEEQMKVLREKYFQDKSDKEISYKDIQWGGIKRSLKLYLNLMDRLPGFLLTVIVDKRIKSFFAKDTKAIREIFKNAGLAEQKPQVAEKLLRISHLVSYLITLLSKDGQKVLWMSDHDSIFQSDRFCASTIVSSLLPDYGRKTPEVFGFATPFAERSLMYLDALSVTDLAAGAIQHYFTQDKIHDEDFLVKNECADIIDWLGHQSFLKKHCVMFRYVNDEELRASNIVFEQKGNTDHNVFVPIYR
jgi:hypothetical protein